MMATKRIDFHYAFQKNGYSIEFSHTISVPFKSDPVDFCGSMAALHKVPCFVIAGIVNFETWFKPLLIYYLDLQTKFCAFVAEENENLYTENARKSLEKLRQNPESIQEIADSIAQRYQKDLKEFAPIRPISDDEVFCDVFQALLKSTPAVIREILAKESELGAEVQQVIAERDRNLALFAEA